MRRRDERVDPPAVRAPSAAREKITAISLCNESVAQREQTFDRAPKVGNLYFLTFAFVSENTNVSRRHSSNAKIHIGTWRSVREKGALKLTGWWEKGRQRVTMPPRFDCSR